VTHEQVLRAVRRILPVHFDCEDIASSLWLDGWVAAGCPATLDVPVSRGVLYGRCIDAIRHAAVCESYDPSKRSETPDVDGLRSLVSKVVDRASLDSVDQQILFRRFYLDQTIRVIAKDLSLTEKHASARLYNLIERLRAAARIENVEPSEE
jgi:hypothetical protein